MKIAFVGAGNSPHVIKWVNALAGEGHEVKLFSMPDHKDAYGEIDGKVEIVYLPTASGENGAKKNASQLKAYLSAESFDAVNAFGMASYGFMAAKAKAERLLLTSTGLDIYRMKLNGTRSFVMKALKQAKGVLATAPNVITHIKENYKKELRYFAVPFGVNMELFKKDRRAENENPVFGSVKFLEDYNGVEAVIEAFYKYTKKYDENARLKIVGDGTEESELKRKVSELGISGSVEFTGYVKNSEMPAVLNTIDVVVQMSPDECLGISGIEAMACEIPMVASDTNGASEYVLNAVTGYLVKAGNTDACADRMADLLKDPSARDRMGGLCRNDVEESYDLKKCLPKYIEALKSVK